MTVTIAPHAQVEVSRNPHLAGKPLAVQQHQDIISVNYAAKKVGVTSMPCEGHRHAPSAPTPCQCGTPLHCGTHSSTVMSANIDSHRSGTPRRCTPWMLPCSCVPLPLLATGWHQGVHQYTRPAVTRTISLTPRSHTPAPLTTLTPALWLQAGVKKHMGPAEARALLRPLGGEVAHVYCEEGLRVSYRPYREASSALIR